MGKSSWLALITLVLVFEINAQTNRYMVFFKDKANSRYRVGQPQEFLSPRAVDRRNKQNISVTVEDLPVNESYVADIENLGFKVFFKTKWFNGALIEVEKNTLGIISALPFVDSIELAAPGSKLSRLGKDKFGKSGKENQRQKGVSNEFQNQLLGIDEMHNDQFRGEGMLVAVCDAGFSNVNNISFFEHLFSDSQIIDTYDFVSNDDYVYEYGSHGTRVFSTMAAYDPNQYIGAVYKADYMLFVTEDIDSEYRIEEYNWVFAAERADSAGVDVINTSLGYDTFNDPSMNYNFSDLDGNTAVISKAASIAASKGILIVNSAGNSGNNPINHPGDAKNILTIGSITANGSRSSFSSVGPTSDGRIKPDLVAIGSSAYVVTSTGIGTGNGTSFSSPQVAGLVTGLWQAYPDLSYLEIIELVKMSADNVSSPNNQLGFGIPNYKAAKNIKESSMQTKNYLVFPNPANDELKIMVRDPIEYNEIVLTIVNSSGQLLYKQDLGFNWLNISNTIDLREFTDGVYILRLSNHNSTESIRVIKK